jgi:HAD superfamily hydrolase (TIGR01509 family)
MTDVALAELVASTGPILLDFDGPVTQLLPPPLNSEVARVARQCLLDAGVVLPSEVATTTDHIAILRCAGRVGGEAQARVEAVCIAAEVGAARLSSPTPGIVDVLEAAKRVNRPVSVVSNNHRDAIEVFLGVHGLLSYVHSIFGRVDGSPELMKPDPHVLKLAIRLLDSSPERCLFIGDSVSDVEAGHAAGVNVLGFGKTPKRTGELVAAGADAVAPENHSIALALQSSPPRHT